MRSLLLPTAAFASFALAGCSTIPTDVADESSTALAPTANPLTIVGVIDRGATFGQHGFEVYGTFHTSGQLRSEVHCAGVLTSSRVMYASQGQMNVAFDSPPSGSTCNFAFESLLDGTRSNVWGNVSLASPELEIAGALDRGVVSQRRYVELYGRFGNVLSFAPRVLCDGVSVSARPDYVSTGQINLSWPDTGAPGSRCAFVVRRTTDGLESPLYGTMPSGRGAILNGFGAYQWGGSSIPVGAFSTLAMGQNRLQEAGFTVARFVLSPVERSGGAYDFYRLGAPFLTECPMNGAPYLPCAIRSREVQATFAAYGLKTIILTASDSTSFGAGGWATGYVDVSFMQTHHDAVAQEYSDATYAIYDTQRGSGKTFVLAEWETDNTIYCGAADWAAYRQSIGGAPPYLKNPCGTGTQPPERLDAVRLWLQARHDGIVDGRNRAMRASLGGVYVGDGIEFNSVHFLQAQGFPTTLGSIIPYVHPDFALYSSYDSQNAGTLEEDLRALKTQLGGAELLIGESGWPMHGVDGIDAWRTTENAKAIQRASLRAAVLWEGFDSMAADAGQHTQPFGVLEADGSDRLVMKMVRNALVSQAARIALHPIATIGGVVDQGTTPDGWHYFETYGTFPGTGWSPIVTCDGSDAAAEVSGTPTTSQINVRFRVAPTGTGYCVFRLLRSDGASTLDFGPKLVGAH